MIAQSCQFSYPVLSALTFRVTSFSVATLPLTPKYFLKTTGKIGLLCLKKYFLKKYQSDTRFCGRVGKWFKFVLTMLVCVSVWCQLVIWGAVLVFTCKNTLIMESHRNALVCPHGEVGKRDDLTSCVETCVRVVYLERG